MSYTFSTTLLQPEMQNPRDPWAFVVLPKVASDTLSRRGRVSIDGTINGHHFIATLHPDGALSHWLKVPHNLMRACGVQFGDALTIAFSQCEPEPEPMIPTDLQSALHASPEAAGTWAATTTWARVDWIHWIESAKQKRTHDKRIANAIDMLAHGKSRVCCFDVSGHYSKAFKPPTPA